MTTSFQILIASRPADYDKRECAQTIARIKARQKLGNWRSEECPDAIGSANRVEWLLNGSYGAGEAMLAWHWCDNLLRGKTGKRLDNAWLAVGRTLTMHVGLYDSTEYTLRKITECWKKQGVDFAAINKQGGDIARQWIEEQE
jgi:hypothetical protein